MTVTEQLWFVVGIGGFIIFMEGAISWIVRQFARQFRRNISGDIVRVIVGLVLFVLALIRLFTLPST